jgi:ATP-dependent Lon protease
MMKDIQVHRLKPEISEEVPYRYRSAAAGYFLRQQMKVLQTDLEKGPERKWKIYVLAET